MSHQGHTVVISDFGLFCSFAETLAHSFGRVLYYSVWEDQNPHSNAYEIGVGLPGVERVMDFEDALTTCDKQKTVIVFPDIHFGGKQQMLRDLGWNVWGSAHADQLENDRGWAKKHFEKVGLKVGKWQVLKGMADLRAFLKDHPGWWVKTSRFRGDFESFVVPKLDERLSKLRKIEYELGLKAADYPFIVEAPIDDACEIAYDGYTVDGQFPTKAPYGVEVKSQAYCGRIVPYGKLPEQIRDTNTALAPFWRRAQCRNMAAVEMRVKKDGSAWMLDASQRFTSPCSELAQIWYTNWPDIIWEGAQGNCIDPVPAAEFGAQMVLHSEAADRQAEVVTFPEALRKNVKLRNCCRRRGQDAVNPQDRGGQAIGAVVAVGKTLDEAIASCIKIADQVKGEGLEAPPEAFDKAKKAIGELKDYGIEF